MGAAPDSKGSPTTVQRLHGPAVAGQDITRRVDRPGVVRPARAEVHPEAARRTAVVAGAVGAADRMAEEAAAAAVVESTEPNRRK